jgi:hypothetical protein
MMQAVGLLVIWGFFPGALPRAGMSQAVGLCFDTDGQYPGVNASAWRPGERASAENVAVQVGHGFAGVRTVVEDEPKTGFR